MNLVWHQRQKKGLGIANIHMTPTPVIAISVPTAHVNAAFRSA